MSVNNEGIGSNFITEQARLNYHLNATKKMQKNITFSCHCKLNNEFMGELRLHEHYRNRRHNLLFFLLLTFNVFQ